MYRRKQLKKFRSLGFKKPVPITKKTFGLIEPETWVVDRTSIKVSRIFQIGFDINMA